MSPERAPRITGFSYDGFNRYFLTICTFPRRPVFSNLDTGAWVRDQMLRTAEAGGFDVTTYCVMPDHVHALAEATREDSDLRRFVTRWKQATGFHWKQRTRQSLWQQGYYDHVLRGDEDERAVVRYIVDNPVRAGLVERPGDYPLTGSSRYTFAALADVIADWSPPGRH